MRRILYNVMQKIYNFDRTVTLISMKKRFLFLLAVFSLSAYPQPWSTFLDSSRAIDWRSGVGFSIPSYSTNCPTQPTLLTGSGNAAANATAIQNALASCDATHNVVNIPTGTYYVTNWTYGSQGKQVVRGAGPNSTHLYMTSGAGACGGFGGAICMLGNPGYYNGSPAILPGGTNQCSWTAGYAQGTTSITLSSCGSAPPLNQTVILDQANDKASDTRGVFLCDTFSAFNCTYKGEISTDADGRVIVGVDYSEAQVVYVTGVTSLGGGSYTVTISPGIYNTNIRSGRTPGAWWPGFVQNDGLENVTLDYSQSTGGSGNSAAITMLDCYQCWVRNIRSIDAARNHVSVIQSAADVVRDSYFYQSQAHSSVSYVIEPDGGVSGLLVENNIFQQVTNPIMFGQCVGCVVGYNFGVDDIYDASPTFAAGSYAGHNAGNNMDLFEGNMFFAIWVDDAWGTSTQTTLFRNSLPGWQAGKTNATTPVILRAWSRIYNLIGNVSGQPGYHDTYQLYPTSGTTGVNLGKENTAIYDIGIADTGGVCTSQKPPCDPLGWTTLMRWGNYDTVTVGVKWDSTEASPGPVPYVNANFSSAYFGSLAHTLPASLYYSSKPSWWPSGHAWPPIGPDVSSGNVGICSSGSTYAGAQATSSSQCTGGTLSPAWASHITSIPAQDCYLNTMGGPPDGTGKVLNFDASLCYGSSGTSPAPSAVVPPTSLVTSAQ
jgi:hypothetical protein